MRARLACAVGVASLLIATGCRRQNTTAPETASHGMRAALDVLPAEARLVMGADLDKLRAQSGWTTVVSAIVRASSSPVDWLARLAASSGIDLTRNVRTILVGLPSERQPDDRFILVVEAEPIDEQRALAGLRAQLGGAVSVEIRAHRQIVIRRGAWTEKAGLPALDRSSEMRRLCERAYVGHALWFAAIVPNDLRRRQMQDPRFADVASIARASGQLDMDNGLRLDVAAETMTADDASSLVRRLNVYLNQMKRHPDMLVHGLAPALDMLRLSVHDAAVHVHLELPAAQLTPYAEKLESLARVLWTK